MPPGDLRDVHAGLERPRDDRDLLGIGPVPAPFRPGDNLDPARPTHGSVIAMVKHMVKSIANPPATLTNLFTARYVGTEQRLPRS